MIDPSLKISRYSRWIASCVLISLSSFALGAPSQTDHQKAVQAFQKNLEAKRAEVRQKSGGFRDPSLPFLLTHGHPTRYCVLLLHGLSDSPYFMRDLAESLYQQGYNVVAPLLSGHGTDAGDLSRVTLEDWRRDVDLGLEVASGLGEKIVAGGFSTGGTLAVDADERYPGKIEGLLLFSPALSFDSKFAFLTCWYKGGYSPEKPRDVPIRYRKISNNGICQLYHLIQELQLSRDKGEKTVPLFTALTEYDDVIDLQWTVDWIEARKTADHFILAYIFPEGKSRLAFSDRARATAIPTKEIRHAQITRRSNNYDDEMNPLYSEMEKALKNFMDRNFPAVKKQREDK
jgi:esterase/lipase